MMSRQILLLLCLSFLCRPGGTASLRPEQFLLMVARLDGPDPATARRLVDDALIAERHGAQGRAYVDLRGLTHGPYSVGDFWLKEAAERLAREGYECEVDMADPIWGEAFPLESAAFYLGWYSEHVAGPFVRPDFSFMKGALACHIHSTSVATLRLREQQWAGPLLACSAAATLGARWKDSPMLPWLETAVP